MIPPAFNRRRFLAASAVGTWAAGTSSFAHRRVHAAASDEVRVAILGAGWRGGELAEHFAKTPGCKLVAIADTDRDLADQLASKYGAAAHQDLRHVLDNPDIDAVVVATCNHWHCLAKLWALDAGKDVYVEKPLSHSQWEGERVVAAAAAGDRIVQIGTQQRSDPMQAAARAFLHDERALGEIRCVVATRLGRREGIGKRNSPLTPPANLDYGLWLGPAQDEPILREKFHYDWHWSWNTGSGEMGNWGIHILDDVRNVAYQDRVALPSGIIAAGGRVAWDDAGQSPNVHVAVLQTETFPTFVALSNLADKPGGSGNWKLTAGLKGNVPASGYAVVCEGGCYFGQRGKGEAVDRNGKRIRGFGGFVGENADTVALHVAAFVDAVRSRDASRVNAPIENGHHSTGWCNLANIAIRAGGSFDHDRLSSASADPAWGHLLQEMGNQLETFGVPAEDLVVSPMLRHDAKTQRFVGESAELANSFLKRTYRQGFEVT